MREVHAGTAGLGPVTATRTSAQSGTRVTARTLLRPGWPLAVLFYGFPLWWALGLAHFAFFIASVPMGIELLRRSPVRAPRWFGIWLVFLVWVLFGTLTLWTHAPGTQYGGGIGRLVNFGMQLPVVIAATVVLLYIYNLRESELSTTRMLRMVGWMFIVTALFGLGGHDRSVLRVQVTHGARHAEGGFSHADFIHAMIHPAARQRQRPVGIRGSHDPSLPSCTPTRGATTSPCSLPCSSRPGSAAESGGGRYVGVGILLAGSDPDHPLPQPRHVAGHGAGPRLHRHQVRDRGADPAPQPGARRRWSSAPSASWRAPSTTRHARFEHPHSNERRGNLAGEVMSTALSSPSSGTAGPAPSRAGTPRSLPPTPRGAGRVAHRPSGPRATSGC